jgi:hypothetical protein
MSVIATINGEQITVEMLDKAVGRYIVQLEEDEEIDFKPTHENLKFIKTEVLNFLMERKLLLKRAEAEGVSVTEEAVNKRINDLRNNYSSVREWEDNLTALKTDEPGLFSEVKNDLIIENFLDKRLGETMRFGEKELRKYYMENEDYMKEPDLFTFYDVHVDTANEVKAVYTLMQKFTDIDLLNSELEKIGLKSNYHRDVPGHQISEETMTMLNDLEPGKIATVEAAEGGMTIFKLIRKIRGERLEFDDIKEKLAEYLMHKARKENIDCVITEEMEKANIDYVDITYLEG